MLHNSIWGGLGASFGGLRPQRPPVATGLVIVCSKHSKYYT